MAGTAAFLPSHATSACCHMHVPRSCKAPLSTCSRDSSVDSACAVDLVLTCPLQPPGTSPPHVLVACRVCVHSTVPGGNLLLLQP